MHFDKPNLYVYRRGEEGAADDGFGFCCRPAAGRRGEETRMARGTEQAITINWEFGTQLDDPPSPVKSLLARKREHYTIPRSSVIYRFQEVPHSGD